MEFDMKWVGKNKLKLEVKFDIDEENPGNYRLAIMKLSRAK